MEEGKETLLKCTKALEMMLVRAYCCNEETVASGSGVREESPKLEYASENEEFNTPPPDLMTFVLEGERYQGIFSYFFLVGRWTKHSLDCSSCGCPAPQSLAEDSSSGESLSRNLYVEVPVENKEVSLCSCCAYSNINKTTVGGAGAITIC